jgi:hypothetical protein
MLPAPGDALVVDINYASFGSATAERLRPATPRDAEVIATLKWLIAGVVLIPPAAGLLVILPLLAGVQRLHLVPGLP